MKDSTDDPALPSLAPLSWRPVIVEDMAALADLARTCLRADGGLTFLAEPPYIKDRFFPDGTGESIGAFILDGRLAGCSVVYAAGNADEPMAKITGLVRPELRGQGIGTSLIRWSRVQAQKLFAGAAARIVLQISTEALTEPAHRLYAAHGFHPVFESLVMQYDLHQPVPDRLPLPGVTIVHWRPELTELFFEAYNNSFRERPGFPGWSRSEWITRVTENDHRPEWSFLASVDNTPAGFVIGNADLTTNPPGGYIWQIGVIPEQRRRRIASALMVETMRRMQASGANTVQLTVNVNNPGAIQAYTVLGFKTTGRRARYERTAEDSFIR